MTVFDEQSVPVLISIHEPLVVFSLPCSAVQGSDRAALVVPWHPVSTTHYSCPLPWKEFSLAALVLMYLMGISISPSLSASPILPVLVLHAGALLLLVTGLHFALWREEEGEWKSQGRIKYKQDTSWTLRRVISKCMCIVLVKILWESLLAHSQEFSFPITGFLYSVK